VRCLESGEVQSVNIFCASEVAILCSVDTLGLLNCVMSYLAKRTGADLLPSLSIR
jgi:hypothetical protein